MFALKYFRGLTFNMYYIYKSSILYIAIFQGFLSNLVKALRKNECLNIGPNSYQVDRSINYSGCIGNECKSNNLKEYRTEDIEKFEKKFKEFKDVEQQDLSMLSPSNYCKCHQRTVYFKYHDFIGKNNTSENIDNVTIYNKEYFVGGTQNFSKNPNSKFSYECVKNPYEYNNIIRLFNNTESNLLWHNSSNMTLIGTFNKYQRYNHIFKHSDITLKNRLYDNFLRFQKKYPKDYNYMTETYTSKRLEIFKNRYKDYKISQDNLWLVKPRGSARGKGIHFLEDINNINKTDIITRYISNPLLLEKKKFDLRIYVLVTGHDPLKIYIFEDSFARLSSDEYDTELNDLNNVYKHLTNVSVNKKKKTNNSTSYVWSVKKVKRYLLEEYGVEFSDIWKKIEDIAIKAVITMNKSEIKREKELNSKNNFNIKSNNIFEVYGFDVLIDNNMKPWLLEINLSPDLSINSKFQKQLKYRLMDDTFNIVGLVPYSHITGLAMEGECEYKDPVDEAVQQSVCEITRPTGGYKRIFPLKENIDYYKKFFEEVSPNNQALWDEIQKNEKI
ncbi:TTL-domain-containing protein [Neocallimastix californiae]|uniref:Tubulin--tyrosine ligase-like protein 5 n=1 Tax=Neocallimastix californiae TaxID=1754190 RepID=A0A1Y1ZU73_9FUNG|nr:TTL-domain-containing protein [Neocallimastix californiae]|eukprot:ORY13325.1 TTL-domain-containing protein [Neocallimastix californiae]